MTINSTSLAGIPPVAGPTAELVLRPTRVLRLPRSPKVIAGLVILGVFGVLAIIGRWIAPYSPNATDQQHWVRHVLVPGTGAGTGFPASYYPLPLPPSAAHWLGTTVFAQDVSSQLLAATQATMFVGLLAAAIATVLSVLFGVTAGYLGGGTDEGLSLVANVFLAIPGLPLLIVLADYMPSAGSSVLLVAAIIAVTTGLALLNVGIDEFINPRLRAAGLSRRTAKKAGISLRSTLGMTPVAHRRAVAVMPQVTAMRPELSSVRTAAEPVLTIRGLSVDYGYGDQAVHAVADCDLVLRRGKVLGLAGESGSGKTTLALAAIRLLRAPAVITGGEVLFHSKPISGEEPAGTIDMLSATEEQLRAIRWSEVAVVLQSSLNALNPVITIGAQFDDLLRVHRPNFSESERLSRAGELLGMVGMNADRLRSYPHELSGGMRQRAMIAMAIALEPQVMILDEPTTALDVVTQREILEELIGLRDRIGFATLFITHDLSLLVELADEIAVMYAGRLMERAPATSLFHRPRLPYTYGLLHCFPPLHGARLAMEGLKGSPPDLRDLPPGCAFHPRCAWAMPRCHQDVPTLAPLDGSAREVACWLHRGEANVPAELARPDPLPSGSGRSGSIARVGEP